MSTDVYVARIDANDGARAKVNKSVPTTTSAMLKPKSIVLLYEDDNNGEEEDLAELRS